MEATDRAWKAFLETKPDFEKLKREARGKGLVEVYETDDEEDGPDEIAVLCGTYKPHPGSKQARCECNSIVWLSLATQETIAKFKGTVHLLCGRCVKRIEDRLGKP